MAGLNILITGSNGNLGMATVKKFLKEGDAVVGLVHEKLDDEFKDPKYDEIKVDLMDSKAANTAIGKAVEINGDIDVAVLTAGGFKMGNLEKTTEDDLLFQYKLNFLTAFNTVKPVLESMKKSGGGKIFFIGSLPGKDTKKGKNTVAYSLAKSQLFQLSNIINADTGNTGVKAHVIVPSTIDTPQNRKSVPDADFSKWEKPSEIAEIIYRYATNPKVDKDILVVQEELGK